MAHRSHRTLTIAPNARLAMEHHARWSAPDEACGLFAIDDSDVVTMVYCLTNVDRSPRTYTVDPYEHLRALEHAERSGWTIGGVFHSHPDGSAELSRTDVAQALDPSWIYVVLGIRAGRIDLGAYTVRDDIVSNVEVITCA